MKMQSDSHRSEAGPEPALLRSAEGCWVCGAPFEERVLGPGAGEVPGFETSLEMLTKCDAGDSTPGHVERNGLGKVRRVPGVPQLVSVRAEC